MQMMILIALLTFVKSHSGSSYSVRNIFNKEFTLTNPKKYLQHDSNIFKSIYKNILGIKNDVEKNSQWYYVHFLSNDISNIQKYIQIESKDEIVKNTFI